MAQLRLSQNVSPGQTVSVDDAKVDALMATGLFERVSNQSRPPNPADAAPASSPEAEEHPAQRTQTASRNATQPRQDQNPAEADQAARTASGRTR